ncbi:MAG: septum formation initiator family protein [Candidatus Cloacimonetes bacterium]|nr:septum formation initiator family protein [Candidatus Cloacimonadota bacterium]
MDTIKRKDISKKNKKKVKKYSYWVIVVSILIYTLFFTRYNLLSYWQTRREHKLYQQAITEVRLDNEELREKIERLENDPEAIEEEARELGMKRIGETVIIIRDKED